MKPELGDVIAENARACRSCNAWCVWATSPNDKRFLLEKGAQGHPRYQLTTKTTSEGIEVKAWITRHGEWAFHNCQTSFTELLPAHLGDKSPIETDSTFDTEQERDQHYE